LVYTSFAAMPWESIFGERIDRAEVVTLIWIHSCAHLFGVVLCGIVFFVLWKLAPPLPRNAKLFALALAMFAMTATGSLLVIPILGLALM
jgi:hypothetical protein